MQNKEFLSVQLRPRICKLSTDDVIEIVDRIGGHGTYAAVIRKMDEEIAKRRILRRKGPVGGIDAEEVRRRQEKLIQEAEEVRKFRNTKRGKLESHFLAVVHCVRSSEKPMSWPTVCRYLQTYYRFKVSVPYLMRSYAEWLQRVETKKAEMLPPVDE
jgi:ribosomal protein S28E/S33